MKIEIRETRQQRNERRAIAAVNNKGQLRLTIFQNQGGETSPPLNPKNKNMTKCKICGNFFHPLGIMMHRKACYEKHSSNYVDNGHKRHKCSICGKVRNEKFMAEIIAWGKYKVITRWGNNVCWSCVDNPDCLHKSKTFSTY